MTEMKKNAHNSCNMVNINKAPARTLWVLGEQGRINHYASKAKSLGPQKNSALKNASDFSHSEFINSNSSAASGYSSPTIIDRCGC